MDLCSSDGNANTIGQMVDNETADTNTKSETLGENNLLYVTCMPFLDMQLKDHLGPVQTSNFTCVESNINN